MPYIFDTNTVIEEPFFHEMAQILGGVKKKTMFNGKESYQNCRCPNCTKEKAVMGYAKSKDTFILACPIDSKICSLSGISLHLLIEKHGGKEMFARWRKARWKFIPDYLPIKNRRINEKTDPRKSSFRELMDLKTQVCQIRMLGENEEC